jgi:hypothetical protein
MINVRDNKYCKITSIARIGSRHLWNEYISLATVVLSVLMRRSLLASLDLIWRCNRWEISEPEEYGVSNRRSLRKDRGLHAVELYYRSSIKYKWTNANQWSSLFSAQMISEFCQKPGFRRVSAARRLDFPTPVVISRNQVSSQSAPHVARACYVGQLLNPPASSTVV